MAKKAARQNRTVVVDFHSNLSEYTTFHRSVGWFMEKVLAVMCVAFFSLHKVGCALRHRYTRHGSRDRTVRVLRGSPVLVPVYQLACLDCGAVFTVLPSFIIRYKRFHVELAAKLLEYNLIMDVSYRFQARMLADLSPSTTLPSPMTLWRLMSWLGTSVPVTSLLLKLGLTPPPALLEDEKFVSQAGHQTYIAAIFSNDLMWWAGYLQSTDEATLKSAFMEFNTKVKGLLPEYSPEVFTVDAHKASQAALKETFPGAKLQECIGHAQRQVNTDLATYQRQNPDVKPEFAKKISDGTWAALNDSTSMRQFSQRMRRVRELADGDPLLTARINKLMARRHRLMTYLKIKFASRTSVPIDQAFKWLNRKYFQMQSLMTTFGGQAFSNAWAIARNFWRFMKGSKRAGQSPVEINGFDLSSRCWVEIVNVCGYGHFCQP